MIDPPFYPPWLVKCVGYGRTKLGPAVFSTGDWTFRFTSEGSLCVSEPTGTWVIDLGRDDTERFVDLVRALDAGRYTSGVFMLREQPETK